MKRRREEGLVARRIPDRRMACWLPLAGSRVSASTVPPPSYVPLSTLPTPLLPKPLGEADFSRIPLQPTREGRRLARPGKRRGSQPRLNRIEVRLPSYRVTVIGRSDSGSEQRRGGGRQATFGRLAPVLRNRGDERGRLTPRLDLEASSIVSISRLGKIVEKERISLSCESK